MKIIELLDQSCIIPEMTATSKQEVLERLFCGLCGPGVH